MCGIVCDDSHNNEIGPLLDVTGDSHTLSYHVYTQLHISGGVSKTVFTLTEGSDTVVAIDDVSIQDKPCDDAYHVEEDISQYATGASFDTAVLKTEQGYSFRLKV